MDVRESSIASLSLEYISEPDLVSNTITFLNRRYFQNLEAINKSAADAAKLIMKAKEASENTQQIRIDKELKSRTQKTLKSMGLDFTVILMKKC